MADGSVPLHRIRQPRVAEIVASRFREDILSGRLKEGDVLQSRSATPADVSGALMHLEPICAGMCAAREDRLTEVVPYLEAESRTQTEQFDNLSRYVPNARPFHESHRVASGAAGAGPSGRGTAHHPSRLVRTKLLKPS